MPWLRGEASGIPGRWTANRQRDHRSRLESLSFKAAEDVNSFQSSAGTGRRVVRWPG